RGADTYEHLNEVRARDGEEGHIGLAGDGARDERLAGAGRADEQHAARDASAEPLEFLRILQELDDLLQILLRLVDAGDVLEGHAAMRLVEKLRLRLAEAHGAAGTVLHLPRQEEPGADDQEERQRIEQDRHEPWRLGRLRLRRDLHALLRQLADEIWI